jgi:hypothetical protein
MASLRAVRVCFWSAEVLLAMYAVRCPGTGSPARLSGTRFAMPHRLLSRAMGKAYGMGFIHKE